MNILKNTGNRVKIKTPAQQTAEICGVSVDYVYKVIRGENTNFKVEITYREIAKAQEEAAEKMQKVVDELAGKK
jgi:hypothetical protein